MNNFPVPDNEMDRLERLRIYDLLNLGKDPDLDVFSQAACLIADCPVSFISIMAMDEISSLILRIEKMFILVE